jgi:hypothetical protein
MDRKNHHAGVGAGGRDLLRCLDAVQERHGNIHHGHIWAELGGELNRFMPIVSRANNLDIRLCIEQKAQSIADDRVIICQNDGDHDFLSFDPLLWVLLAIGIFTSIVVPFL